MKLYAIKNDDGEWLNFDECGDHYWYLSGETWSDKNAADSYANDFHGHVVELVEAPATVVVSEEEAEMLETAKNPTFRPSSVITSYSNDHGGWDLTSDLEDRLMHAYVNGWTVEKPKRYVLPMDGMGDNLGYSYIEDGVWWINTAPTRQYAVEHGYTVTQSDIDAAPDWVKAITPVEVTDDEQ